MYSPGMEHVVMVVTKISLYIHILIPHPLKFPSKSWACIHYSMC